MASWAWPHTPADNLARVRLVGGPFDGEEVGFLPPDTTAPAQIAWGGWMPWGFDSWLYQWDGERIVDRGRTDALIYRPTGRRLGPEEIPPLIADDAEVWADGADLMMMYSGYAPEQLWPGV